ncbi:MAG TPA: hypothetical protein DD670_16330 [Planctomycetaceae bacterium]|nr:hypothetical protein [Planctomycetaceae bacterium]
MDDWNPYAAPAEPDPADNLPADEIDPNRPAGLWRKDKLLILRRDAVVPDWCARTGGPAGGRQRILRLRWMPGWLQVGYIILSIALVTTILYLGSHEMTTMIVVVLVLVASTASRSLIRRAEVEIGCCQAARSRDYAFAAVRFVVLLAVVGGYFVAVYWFGHRPRGYFLVIFLTSWALLRVLHLLVRPLTVAHIDDEYVHLKNIHPDYLARLPEWPGD